jgi:small subunit ribosomal protein S16
MASRGGGPPCATHSRSVCRNSGPSGSEGWQVVVGPYDKLIEEQNVSHTFAADGVEEAVVLPSCVTDSRAARDSSFVEVLGHYNPRTKPETLDINRDRLEHWIKAGARPSDTIRTLVRANARGAGGCRPTRSAVSRARDLVEVVARRHRSPQRRAGDRASASRADAGGVVHGAQATWGVSSVVRVGPPPRCGRW